MKGIANYIAKGLVYSDGRDHCSESYKYSTMLLKLENWCQDPLSAIISGLWKELVCV